VTTAPLSLSAGGRSAFVFTATASNHALDVTCAQSSAAAFVVRRFNGAALAPQYSQVARSVGCALGATARVPFSGLTIGQRVSVLVETFDTLNATVALVTP